MRLYRLCAKGLLALVRRGGREGLSSSSGRPQNEINQVQPAPPHLQGAPSKLSHKDFLLMHQVHCTEQYFFRRVLNVLIRV